MFTETQKIAVRKKSAVDAIRKNFNFFIFTYFILQIPNQVRNDSDTWHLPVKDESTAGIVGARRRRVAPAMEPKGGSRNGVSSDPGKPLAKKGAARKKI